jgi:hypothetical protein
MGRRLPRRLSVLHYRKLRLGETGVRRVCCAGTYSVVFLRIFLRFMLGRLM